LTNQQVNICLLFFFITNVRGSDGIRSAYTQVGQVIAAVFAGSGGILGARGLMYGNNRGSCQRSGIFFSDDPLDLSCGFLRL
jgi:hypothetical protein